MKNTLSFADLFGPQMDPSQISPGSFAPTSSSYIQSLQEQVRSGSNAANLLALSQPLNEFVATYSGAGNVKDVVNRLFPMAPVAGVNFQYLKYDSKEAFTLLTEAQITRGIGAKWNEIIRKGQRVAGFTKEKGLTIVLDRQMGGKNPVIQQQHVKTVVDALYLAELGIGLSVLDANATTDTAVEYGTGDAAKVNPDKDIMRAKKLSGDARGIDPNAMIMANSYDLAREWCYMDLADAGGKYNYVTGADAMAQKFGFDWLHILKQRIQNSGTTGDKKGMKDADTATTTVGTSYIYYADPSPTTQTPTNVARYVDVAAGGDMTVYVDDQDPAMTKITVWYASTIDLVSSLGIRKRVATYTEPA